MICLGWIVNSYYSRKHRFQISHTCSVVIIGWEWSVEYFCSRWGNICTSFQEEERFEHKFMVCAFFSAFINLSKHKHKIIKTSANSNTWAVTIVFYAIIWEIRLIFFYFYIDLFLYCFVSNMDWVYEVSERSWLEEVRTCFYFILFIFWNNLKSWGFRVTLHPIGVSFGKLWMHLFWKRRSHKWSLRASAHEGVIWSGFEKLEIPTCGNTKGYGDQLFKTTFDIPERKCLKICLGFE